MQKTTIKNDPGTRLIVPLSARYLNDLPKTFLGDKNRTNLEGKESDICKHDTHEFNKLKSIDENDDCQSQTISRIVSSLANNSKEYSSNIGEDSDGFNQMQRSPLNIRYECAAKDRSKNGVLILERRKQLSEVNYNSTNSSISNNNSHLLTNVSKLSSNSKNSLASRNVISVQPSQVPCYNNFVNPSPKVHQHQITSHLNISNDMTPLSQLSLPTEEKESGKYVSNKQAPTIDRERVRPTKSISISNRLDQNPRNTMYCRTLTIGDKIELNNLSNNSQSNRAIQNISADQFTNSFMNNSNLLQGIKKHALEAAKQRIESMNTKERTHSTIQTNLEKFIKEKMKGGAENEKTKLMGNTDAGTNKSIEKGKTDVNSHKENPFKKYYRDPTSKTSISKEELRSSIEQIGVSTVKEIERENEQLRSLLKKSQEEAARTLEERNKFERDLENTQELVKKLEQKNSKFFTNEAPKVDMTVGKKRSKSSHMRESSEQHGFVENSWETQILDALESSSKREALQNLDNLIRDHKYCLKFLKSIEELMRICTNGSENNKENISGEENIKTNQLAKKLIIMTKSPENLNSVNNPGTTRNNHFQEAITMKHSRLGSPSTPIEFYGEKNSSSKSKLKEIWKWVKCLVKDNVRTAEDTKKKADSGELNLKIKQLARENETMGSIIKKINIITGIDWMKGTEDIKRPVF